MKTFIEFFHSRQSELISRLKTIVTPVQFKTVLTLEGGRLAIGVLESSNTSELEKVKKNLVDIINQEITEENFKEYVKKEFSKQDASYWDPVQERNIQLFSKKEPEDLFDELNLEY